MVMLKGKKYSSTEFTLVVSTHWVNSADNKIDIYIFFKIGFDISCK